MNERGTVTLTLPLDVFITLQRHLISEELNIAYREDGKGDLTGLFEAIYGKKPKPDVSMS